MSSNKIKVLPSKAQSINNNSSSPSPPRPGFPQRVVPSHRESYPRIESPIGSQKSFGGFNEQKIVLAPTSQLIPTTFINNNSFEPTQTIQEEHEDEIYTCKAADDNCFMEDIPETKQRFEPTATVDNSNSFQVTSPTEEYIPTSTFDYLYEFSETRKVLEEFFKCPDNDQIKELEKFSDFNESDDSLVSCTSAKLLCRFSHILLSGYSVRLPRSDREGNGEALQPANHSDDDYTGKRH